MKKQFRFRKATFDFGNGTETPIQFVAAESPSKGNATHFTLLMGANGTYKSRALAGCIELLCFRGGHLESKGGAGGLSCLDAEVEVEGMTHIIGRETAESDDDWFLPARVLAIANLVKDRFSFTDGRKDEELDRFYHYLGVRQSTNLTTTGAMDRIVADAFVHILSDRKKTKNILGWIENLFPNFELAFGVTNLRSRGPEKFIADPKAYLSSATGPERIYRERLTPDDLEHRRSRIKELIGFIQQFAEPKAKMASVRSVGVSRMKVMSLKGLGVKGQRQIAGLADAFEFARQFRFLGGPMMLLRDKRRGDSPWLELTNLSSGEQNLFSTGARLIAYSVPGSFIVIDEPEVSLNVVWQQQYMNLISEALRGAPGCHVVIASHSPYLVSDLRADNSTVVVANLSDGQVRYTSHAGEFWGWGAESILYEVLGIPSASNFLFNRELASILHHIQGGVKDLDLLNGFLEKCQGLNFQGEGDALNTVIREIEAYRKEIAL